MFCCCCCCCRCRCCNKSFEWPCLWLSLLMGRINDTEQISLHFLLRRYRHKWHRNRLRLKFTFLTWNYDSFLNCVDTLIHNCSNYSAEESVTDWNPFFYGSWPVHSQVDRFHSILFTLIYFYFALNIIILLQSIWFVHHTIKIGSIKSFELFGVLCSVYLCNFGDT